MEKIQSLYLFVVLSAAIVTILLSFCFLFINVPNVQPLSAYKKSRFLLSMAYLILGIGNLLVLIAFYQKIEIDRNLLFPIIVVISSLQAFLFFSTLICLLDVRYIIRRKYILLFCILICAYLIIFCSPIGNVFICRLANTLFYIYYLFQLLYYTFQFLKNEKYLRKKLSDFYSGDEEKRINWIHFSFFAALTVGLLVAIALLFINFTFLLILIFVYSLFYIWFAFHFLNYPVLLSGLKDCFTPDLEKESPSISYYQLGDAIGKWISEKRFLHPEITLNQLALYFCTNRTYLSSYINTEMKTNFNGWINSLRIAEAINLMQEHPDWPIIRICDETGFADASCFDRHFKRATGVTPSTYRNRLLNR